MSEETETLEINQKCSMRQKIADADTTDAFVDSQVVDCRLLKSVLLHIIESGGANAIKYNVYGCVYPSVWKLLNSSPVVVAAGQSEFEPNRWDAWGYLKVAFASNVGGSAGHVKIFVSGKA